MNLRLMFSCHSKAYYFMDHRCYCASEHDHGVGGKVSEDQRNRTDNLGSRTETQPRPGLHTALVSCLLTCAHDS